MEIYGWDGRMLAARVEPKNRNRESEERRRRSCCVKTRLTRKAPYKPDAGNLPVRFDERREETERCQMAQATAPLFDSTIHVILSERKRLSVCLQLRTYRCAAANRRFGPRLCENVRARERRRIVFSIVFSRLWRSAFLFFKLTESRRNFYPQIQFRSFHTA